ncbi:hypothetical protein L1049_002888 [Liquidambar formosana]|uniref:Spatacsin C-terminal domain-containing protein n=1 Tax=Liquidambar formosana TaxID=63359 RepID=A0AAP0NGM6_LIQFO
MGCSFGGEGPAILQLHKWDPSEVQLNLSEFREAFISPTRELLLLLSYQCEALLLPLITGDSINCNDPESYCHENIFCSRALAEPNRSDSKDNIPCSSGSVAMACDNDCSPASNISTSNDYPFVCDVNSLAWGLCGDTYNQHEDGAFREFLFVSGRHGVTVHAFCQPHKTIEMAKPSLEGEFEQGLWVEWGPSATLAHNVVVHECSSLCCDAPENFLDVNQTNGTGESQHKFCREDGVDELSRNSTSKRWLQTFLTKVETMECDGNVCTRFPAKPSLPCSAKVVSFSLFDSNSLLLDFLSHANSRPNKMETQKETVLDSANDTSIRSDSSSSSLQFKHDILSKFLGVGTNISYKCSRVFSSNSHHLIGFVLSLVDSVTVKASDQCERSLSKLLLAVAKLDIWGIQWVCSVKLEESLNIGLEAEWTDFRFSENLIVCLNASGLIFFYGAITGEYVSHLDVLQICGLNPQSNLQEREQSSVEGDLVPKSSDIQAEHVDEVHAKSTYQTSDSSGKRIFRRLIVASYSSLLAVVDEYGVVYVIFAGDYMPDKYYSFEKLFPHYQNLGLGMLVGWEVGGSEIGYQRVFSNLSGFHWLDFSSKRHGSFPSFDKNGNSVLQKIQDQSIQGKRGQYDLYMSGFSAASQIIDRSILSSKSPSYHMRKMFLPTERFNEDDFICFSPLGITRLIRKQHIKGKKSFQIVHSHLHVGSAVHDDKCLNSGCEMFNLQGGEETSVGEAVGCTFQGCFYLVTQGGLSVVLPSVSVSSNFLPIESIGYRHSSVSTGIGHQAGNSLEMKESNQLWSPWKIEVLDKVLLYEGPEEADHLCLENGWDLKISRMRRLQLALDYLKFDEIEQSLEMLVGVDLAEEGILRLLFAIVYLMFHKVGNDNEVSAASRLLTLATCFATKMIRKYGLVQRKKHAFIPQDVRGTWIHSLPPVLLGKVNKEMGNSRKLQEMAHYLEIIRNLQCRLSAKFKRRGPGLVDDREALSLVGTNLPQDDSHHSIFPADSVSSETPNQHELSFPVSASGFNSEKLALIPIESLDKSQLDSENFSELSLLVSQGGVLGKKVLPSENPKDMIARWEIDNLDLKTVVRDALLSGRLPLAVLQLHLHRLRDLVTDKEPRDTFTEVRDVGRVIAYDLFLKGETGLAVATLQRLGEDIENSLKQLVFGTVRRSLRMQIAEEMKRYGYLAPYEWKILERIALIERLYPSSSFWRTFLGRQKEFMGVSSSLNSTGGINLRILDLHLFNNLVIECGEIDGVVLDNADGGYWAAAAVWSNTWDQRTIDRIVLDQPFLMGVHVLWESQLEYHICHNNWEEVSKLLDMIPTSLLSDGSLQIGMDGLETAPTARCSAEFSDYGHYICSLKNWTL